MKLLAVLVLLGAAAVDAQSWWSWFSTPAIDDSTPRATWDGLRVTFGVSPFGNNFDRLPRTKEMAEQEGWTLFGPNRCTAGTWRGFRYVKDNDPAVTLLFDKNGYIAGLQMGVLKSELPSDGSIPPQQVTPPWIEDKDMWLLTAYFIQPSDICSDGRTEAEYQDEGTGTDLYIQTGPNPTSDIMTIPLQQSDLEGTEWTEGKCFWGMGKHYWWNLRVDMDCKEFYPVFIMYNGGKLDAFGWNIGTYLGSPRYEHPAAGFGMFMDPVPTCLADHSGSLSTMHVYLTNGYPPFFNHC
ncbi:Hypp1872 [Branchiostoma lanceolatum]|uniref:Hypp1872 protein n=1 Tax=Branchiostoma lanceolatum TaxID=7740 RepID=A0A8K0EMQ0_BRALA|nr:Hypp1872 [Branchiostoma lanceolatum]